ncbi:hypothetical protein [uncultured Chitinophaga sp.]|uniref:hypothetical protein n=1 Tax=uncultured Chitinophaga sp. TaxID=339340 RepID=UPI002608FD00|nr:hypothetical protein [uncultured Chitinophaga sp.]
MNDILWSIMIVLFCFLPMLYLVFLWILIEGREFFFSFWYELFVYSRPDFKMKYTGPYTGKSVSLFQHKENSEDDLKLAVEIWHEYKYYCYQKFLK